MPLNITGTFTARRNPGEFIVSEQEGTLSREVVTLATNKIYQDGTVVKATPVGQATHATPLTADDFETEGLAESVTLLGVVIGYHDTTATGSNAAVAGVPVIARLAEVDASLLVLFSGATAPELADVIIALKALNIVGR